MIQFNESRLAPLYHFMNFQKMQNVFENDLMPARWIHDIPGIGKVRGNSFTRNPRLEMFRVTKITVDQLKLSQTHKIIPLDGQATFSRSSSWTIHRTDRNTVRPDRLLLMEEFVFGDIKNLHIFISNIQLLYGDEFHSLTPNEKIGAYKIARAYSKKWKIPFKVDPRILKHNIETLRRWRDPERRDPKFMTF